MSSLLTMALSAQQHQFFRSSCRRFTELLGSLRAIAAVFIVLAICAPQVAAADDRGAAVGKVLSARGATAHVDGGAVRFLGRGDPIYKGDVISTARRSFAVIKMVDKTNVTVRPKTVLRFDNFEVKPKRESAIVSLFRGGLRALTGFISKRKRDAFKIKTPIATIGIRGTEFDARICAEGDCGGEATGLKRASNLVRRSEVVGRVVALRGKAQRETADGKVSPVGSMSPVVVGDLLSTEARSFMVIVYRDGTRMTLLQNTQFKVEALDTAGNRPKSVEKKAAKESAVFRLFRGGLRVLSGLIGKRNPGGFRINAATATIGIRGTTFDAICEGSSCADGSGVFVSTQSGTALLNGNAVNSGQVGVVEQGVFRFVPTLPTAPTLPPALSPEAIDVDEQQLWQEGALEGTPDGLYLACRSGHCAVDDVDLGKGEALFKGDEAQPARRLVEIPQFLTADPYFKSQSLLNAPLSIDTEVDASEACVVP